MPSIAKAFLHRSAAGHNRVLRQRSRRLGCSFFDYAFNVNLAAPTSVGMLQQLGVMPELPRPVEPVRTLERLATARTRKEEKERWLS
jgi:hypothetical protein